MAEKTKICSECGKELTIEDIKILSTSYKANMNLITKEISIKGLPSKTYCPKCYPNHAKTNKCEYCGDLKTLMEIQFIIPVKKDHFVYPPNHNKEKGITCCFDCKEKTFYAHINPKMLKHGRKKAKLSLKKASEGILSIERLEKAESDRNILSYHEFRQLANRYNRGINYFYLNKKPSLRTILKWKIYSIQEGIMLYLVKKWDIDLQDIEKKINWG